jgi:hypothetical protein
MRIFTTIILCFVWLSSFSQEKTIVVKKENPELTLNGSIKNKSKIKRSVFTEILKLQVLNCNCSVVSYEILLPLPDGRVVVMNVQSEYITEEAARILINMVTGGHLTITSVKARNGDEVISLPSFSVEIID